MAIYATNHSLISIKVVVHILTKLIPPETVILNMDPKDLTLQTLYSRVKDLPDPTAAILPTASLVLELPFSWQDSADYLRELVNGGFVARKEGHVPAVALTSQGLAHLVGSVG